MTSIENCIFSFFVSAISCVCHKFSQFSSRPSNQHETIQQKECISYISYILSIFIEQTAWNFVFNRGCPSRFLILMDVLSTTCTPWLFVCRQLVDLLFSQFIAFKTLTRLCNAARGGLAATSCFRWKRRNDVLGTKCISLWNQWTEPQKQTKRQ